MDNNNKPIGFLDSGVGGLSVMKEAIKIMPNENYIYFGDSKNAPYGVKSTKEIRDLTFKAVEFLISKGIKGLVVACNTATSAAVRELRTVYPDMPLVGIEPAIKPAVELGRDGKILIMATPMTIKQDKFKLLLDKYKDKAEIVPIPCAGLMEFIESGVLDGIELEYYLKEKLSDYSSENVSSVVLGCTHYPFVKDSISKILGKNVEVIDGGEGTAREIKRRLAEKNLLNTNTTKGKIEIYNSLGEDKIIDLSWKLLS
ncbi:glutamate racemase [Clostridium celatum]|uniref:Glutamate racemase n=1 Tax=Clostridium celatum DSM 1785 TaxID=545697 RepID=L1QP80_9CLOT|nr:glutamate racemase [Clostridium celatum]EKY29789.1 glutamate racemase [Clostridium celatum DSM 1785]MCE9654829.1 glutamate racemase [Clostridium celatum]MDU2265073.1 glutamate racemase [Clostridium celatum]MDU3722657.1 glutamate racemase [Clostridium celatum]MDU6294565.1 glutamate racemase [Clostridium celatum]